MLWGPGPSAVASTATPLAPARLTVFRMAPPSRNATLPPSTGTATPALLNVTVAVRAMGVVELVLAAETVKLVDVAMLPVTLGEAWTVIVALLGAKLLV